MSDSDDDRAPAARLAPMDKGAKRARDWSGIEDDDDGTGVEADKRNTAQHALIMQTMQEAMGGKGRKQAAPAVRKGKTLQEIEDEEGGPVKESLLSIAQAKRAAARKKGAHEDDTDVPADIEVFEEELDAEAQAELAAAKGDDVVPLMPFNLNEERAGGHFDEEGNYIEDKAQKNDTDAWLEQAEVVDEKTKALIEARLKAEQEAEAEERRRAAAPMTDRQIAQLKMEIASHMQPGETIARVLKRIKAEAAPPGAAAAGKVLTKREKLRLQQQQRGDGGGGASDAATGATGATVATAATAGSSSKGLGLLERLTEVADQLFAEGETDVFTCTKEQLEKAASMWLPKPPPASNSNSNSNAAPAAGLVAAAPAAAAAAAAAGADEDDDMFGDGFEAPSASEAAEKPGQPTPGGAAPASAPAAGPAAAPGQAPGGSGIGAGGAAPGAGAVGAAAGRGAAQRPCTDFESWPIKELARYLKESGVETAGAVEKEDLVAKARKAEAAAWEAEQAAAAAAAAAAVPEGFEFDAASGYYRSGATGMYYDAGSGSYYDGTNWLRYDEATGQYVPLAQ